MGISLSEIENFYEWEYRAYYSAAEAIEKNDVLRFRELSDKDFNRIKREQLFNLGYDFLAAEKERQRKSKQKRLAEFNKLKEASK